MSQTVTVKGPSFPIAGLLGVAFVVLKLTGVIAWSWVWVLAPFWIPLALVIGFLLIGALVAVVLWALDRK